MRLAPTNTNTTLATSASGIDVPFFRRAYSTLEVLEAFAEDAMTDMVANQWNDGISDVRKGVEYLEALGEPDPTESLSSVITYADQAAADGDLTPGEFANVRVTAQQLREAIAPYITYS